MLVRMLVLVLLCSCGNDATFDGSKTGDANHFDIEFNVLNTSYTHELDMNEGESIDVQIEAESGDISLNIQKEDEKPVYRGNKMKSGNFKVGVESAGKYTLTVTGKKAKGHVVLTREG
ncbi:hypothetical protein [Butyrivibrio sp. YAB3001]|uniref:hypothetical protein n=1 Tax=Butyrivibrio sp. YAB3001 TaxID=1520812 RepID=UPI001130A315|nr:hypothetical protein [Butyrivibrio sp. YAB3001]